jgi:hypothetical protein
MPGMETIERTEDEDAHAAILHLDGLGDYRKMER